MVHSNNHIIVSKDKEDRVTASDKIEGIMDQIHNVDVDSSWTLEML